MQVNRLFVVNNVPQKRSFFTTSWNNRRIGWTVDELLKLKGPRCLKPHRVMWKFLDKTKRNGIFSQPPVGAPSISLATAVSSIACRTIPETKRSSILNKLLMRNITEILATNDIGLPLWGQDIQICRVRVTPDFSAVHVYWIPQGGDTDEKIQYLLNKAANPLRRELINLRVMGLVPVIHFVKDKHYALLAEVDRRLKIADFGDDHVPALKDTDHLREDLQLVTRLSSTLKKKITDLELSEPFETNEEKDLPAMRMDVFSLDYNKILRTVKQGIAKTGKPSEKLEEILENPKAVFEIPSNSIMDKKSWDKAAFKKFIKQRSVKQKKMQQLKNREDAFESKTFLELYQEAESELDPYNEYANKFNDEDEDFIDYDERYEQKQ